MPEVLFLFFRIICFENLYQMAAVMLQTVTIVCAKFSKKMLFLRVLLTSILRVNSTALPTTTTTHACYLNILQLGDLKEELLMKSDVFCCTYQHVECLHFFPVSIQWIFLLQIFGLYLTLCRGRFIPINKTELTECPAFQKTPEEENP